MLAILGVGLAAVAVQAWLGDAPGWSDVRSFSGAPLLSPLVLLYLLVVNGFGEELGWRGFLFHHLEPRLGLLSGSVVLAWLYLDGGRSTLLVASWHLADNLSSATASTQGTIAAATSTAIMVAAVVIVIRDLRHGSSTDARGAGDRGRLGP